MINIKPHTTQWREYITLGKTCGIHSNICRRGNESFTKRVNLLRGLSVLYRNSVNISTNLLIVSWQVYGNKIMVHVYVWNIPLTVKNLTIKGCRCRISYASTLSRFFVWGLYSIKFRISPIPLLLHGTIKFLLTIFCNLFFVNVKHSRKYNLRIK